VAALTHPLRPQLHSAPSRPFRHSVIDEGEQGFLARSGAKIEVATGQRRLWKELGSPKPAGAIGIQEILLTPDGKSYVYRYARNLTDLYQVEGLIQSPGRRRPSISGAEWLAISPVIATDAILGERTTSNT
jgi:hypothetical protein